jgi:transposase
LAKNAFQVHGFEREGGEPVRRKLSRSRMRAFFAQIAPCRVGMEACGSAHYWARELTAMGHEVVLMAPTYVKPYVKRGKNDALDAAAVCEAMSRPDMRFVPIKSADQQAVLMLHKTRELMVKQRTMSVNAAHAAIWRSSALSSPGASAGWPSCLRWPTPRQLCRKRRERRRSCWPRISKGSIDRSTRRKTKSPPPTPETGPAS